MLVILLALLIIIVVLVIWYYIANQFASIAEMKGHNGRSYFWWTFFLSAVGMAMVIALPDVTNRKLIEELISKSNNTEEKENSTKNKTQIGVAQTPPTAGGKTEHGPETLKDYLNRALQYETDKDIVDYIQGLYTKMNIPGLSTNFKPAEKDIISQLIKVPTTQLRGKIEHILWTL